ncbi:MAG: sugar phosphate isomerase/epimerase family protein [Anaerolineae bacterium]
MKIGIDSYCYHRYFGEIYPNQTDPGRRMSYRDFLRRAVELGVDGVSLETCFFENFSDSYLASLKEIIDEGRLEVVVAWGHPKGFEGGKKPEAMEEMKAMFRVCHALGAKVMRVVGSSLDYRNDPHGPQIDALTQLFKEGARMAEGEGVRLAVENHFDFTAEEYLDLIQRVNSPYFGMTFDTGNALRIGDDPVEAARMLAPYVFATHTKDVAPLYGVSPKEWHFFACVPIGQGIINIPALVDALLVGGYQGLFAIELDYMDPRYRDEDWAVEESVKYLRNLRQRRAVGITGG